MGGPAKYHSSKVKNSSNRACAHRHVFFTSVDSVISSDGAGDEGKEGEEHT